MDYGLLEEKVAFRLGADRCLDYNYLVSGRRVSLGNSGNQIIGRRVLYYPRAVSTMDLAREEAIHGAPEGTVVMAGEQTGGRGRAGRSWLSPRGSLALSVILRPPLAQLSSLVMLASLAVASTVESTGLGAQVKWPNDVLIGGKKVSGILTENSVQGDVLEWAVIGIGLNVNFEPADFPGIATIATSLSAELGRGLPEREVYRRLLAEMDKWYLALREGQDIFSEWRRRLVTLGKKVRAVGDSVLEGVAEDVERDGRLRLRRADGTLTLISAGDVLLRES